MRLAESIEKQGFFWPPDHKDEVTPGTLKVSRSGRIDLNLFDLNIDDDTRDPEARLVPRFWPSEEEKQVRPRILGIVGGQGVTLTNCSYRGWNGRLGGGVATAVYAARRAFFGTWEDGDGDLTFTSVTLEIEGLHDWLQFNSLENTSDFSSSIPLTTQQFTYSRPEDVTVHLANGIELTFGLSARLPGIGVGTTKATFEQQSYVTISTKESMSFRVFLDLATKVQNFLSLAIDQPLNLLSIRAQTPEVMHGEDEAMIDVYADTVELANRVGRIAWHRTLFSYPDIADRFETMFNEWLGHYQKAEPVFNLYFAVAADAYRNIEGKFLAITQAVEGFHRRFLPDTLKMPKDEFMRLKRDAASAFPVEHRHIIHSSLQNANVPSLRERIAAMIEPFAKHFGEERERNDFAKDVAEMRNDLAHQIGRSDESRDQLSHLLTMTNKLEALFQMHLLRLLGLDDSRIDKIAVKHLEHKLNPVIQRVD